MALCEYSTYCFPHTKHGKKRHNGYVQMALLIAMISGEKDESERNWGSVSVQTKADSFGKIPQFI